MTQPAPSSHQTYPCHDCGAHLQFAPGTTALACPYCGARQEIHVPTQMVAERDYHALGEQNRRSPQQSAPNLFVCTGCGAHTESDAWSDVCQFCGAAVVADQFDPDLVAPDGLIPFHVDKGGARKALRDWVSSRWFAPNAFKNVHEAESLKSTYLPHWTWDAATVSHYQGERGEHYYTEDKDGNRKRNTRWFPAAGTVTRDFDDVVVPATTHVNPKRLESLSESWETGAATGYQPQFLSGHHTQRYDLGPDDALNEAKRKMSAVIQRDVRNHIGGDEQRVHRIDTEYRNLTYKLLLLPVWILAYLFGGKTWQVLVNGQNGKVSGDRPFSPWKIAFAVAVGLVVAAGAVYLYYLSR
ncbi:hypothetical protein [Glycomyces albidus]|uniref:Zinc ribbon domain-containing protein n=1 Tax=Glycomyces albidus TaxID=2656774 RepID=A0A6L5GFE3_9ACTN|nr:hypothetical protein [Glycomyces albidus]MQM28388.1 hypothetical protein [Glycomyces albidus]